MRQIPQRQAPLLLVLAVICASTGFALAGETGKPHIFRDRCAALFANVQNVAMEAKDWSLKASDGVNAYLTGYDSSHKIAVVPQFLGHFFGDMAPDLQKSDTPFLRKAGAAVANGLQGLLKSLVPLPLPEGRKSEVQKLFLRLMKDPSFQPSAMEVQLLKDVNGWNLFLSRRAFFQQNPNSANFRKLLDFSASSLLWLNAGMALNQAKEMSENVATFDELINGPSEDEKGNPIVQVLVETTPFPHTALRIGNRVYSYGVEYMTAKGLAIYLAQPPPPPEGRQDQNVTDLQKGMDPFPDLKLFAGMAAKASGSFLARSLRVTTLHLDPDKVKIIRRQLELSTGKQYDNETMVNDCNTMIKKALDGSGAFNIPVGIDTLPSMTSTYLSLRRALGDKRVGPTQLALSQREDAGIFHLARNTWIAMIEGKLALGLLPYNGASRAFFDLSHKEVESMQRHTPEEKKLIDQWAQETRDGIDQEMNELFGGKTSWLNAKDSMDFRKRRSKAARELLRLELESREKEANEVMDTDSSDFMDLLKAQAQLEALDSLRRSWTRRIDDYEARRWYLNSPETASDQVKVR